MAAESEAIATMAPSVLSAPVVGYSGTSGVSQTIPSTVTSAVSVFSVLSSLFYYVAGAWALRNAVTKSSTKNGNFNKIMLRPDIFDFKVVYYLKAFIHK